MQFFISISEKVLGEIAGDKTTNIVWKNWKSSIAKLANQTSLKKKCTTQNELDMYIEDHLDYLFHHHGLEECRC